MITLENSLAEPLKIWAKQQLLEVEKKITEFADQRTKLKQILNNTNHTDLEIKKPGFAKKYDKNLSLSKKIDYVLSKSDHLTSSQITDNVIGLEPILGKDRPFLLKQISTILSIGNDKKYLREKTEGSKYVYNLKDSLV